MDSTRLGRVDSVGIGSVRIGWNRFGSVRFDLVDQVDDGGTAVLFAVILFPLLLLCLSREFWLLLLWLLPLLLLLLLLLGQIYARGR